MSDLWATYNMLSVEGYIYQTKVNGFAPALRHKSN